ncbi:MAG: TonB family protein [Bacteroidota bacterium]
MKKKSIIKQVYQLLGMAVLAVLIALPVQAQTEKSVESFSELEEMEDINTENLKQIHKVAEKYPEFSYKYTMEDGEIQDVVVTGVDNTVDKKRLEVAIFDLESNKNMMKAKPNRIGVFYSVDKDPEYKGEMELDRKIQSNLKYPEKVKNWGLEGTIFVKFVVDENGEIPFATTSSNIETSRENYLKDLQEQAVEAVKATSGEWEPGKVKDVDVASLAVVPITFDFEKDPAIRALIR